MLSFGIVSRTRFGCQIHSNVCFPLLFIRVCFSLLLPLTVSPRRGWHWTCKTIHHHRGTWHGYHHKQTTRKHFLLFAATIRDDGTKKTFTTSSAARLTQRLGVGISPSAMLSFHSHFFPLPTHPIHSRHADFHATRWCGAYIQMKWFKLPKRDVCIFLIKFLFMLMSIQSHLSVFVSFASQFFFQIEQEQQPTSR